MALLKSCFAMAALISAVSCGPGQDVGSSGTGADIAAKPTDDFGPLNVFEDNGGSGVLEQGSSGVLTGFGDCVVLAVDAGDEDFVFNLAWGRSVVEWDEEREAIVVVSSGSMLFEQTRIAFSGGEGPGPAIDWVNRPDGCPDAEFLTVDRVDEVLS